MVAMSAAAVDSPVAPVPASEPIDQNHLARMTLGDKRLEREVLQLFDRQSELLLARMSDVPVTAIVTLAHTLSGSARGIGAWRVAAAAEAVEGTALNDPGRVTHALARLEAAVREVRAAIAVVLYVR